MVRLAVKTRHVPVVRHAKTSQRVRSQRFAVLATVSLHRRSCTKSPRAIVSLRLNNLISCQAAHAVKNQPC
jgi:ATP-dependent RNA helicase RhlE